MIAIVVVGRRRRLRWSCSICRVLKLTFIARGIEFPLGNWHLLGEVIYNRDSGKGEKELGYIDLDHGECSVQ